MFLPLEMGWRHLCFESWPVDPALMDSHLLETDPVYFYSPGIDVVAEPSRRAPRGGQT